MSNVYALIEGQTENAVLQKIIAPFLGSKGVFLFPRIVGKPGHKGGVRNFSAVMMELRNLLRQDQDGFVTTFFDFYALPTNWPGKNEAGLVCVDDKPIKIEESMSKEIEGLFGNSFDPARFIPYVQMHEIEALLFSDVEIMAEKFGKPGIKSDLQSIVTGCGGCEKIDDDPVTAPSKRIQSLYPGYIKGRSNFAHAPIILEEIGLSTVRASCPHFDSWISKLESLGSSPP